MISFVTVLQTEIPTVDDGYTRTRSARSFIRLTPLKIPILQAAYHSFSPKS